MVCAGGYQFNKFQFIEPTQLPQTRIATKFSCKMQVAVLYFNQEGYCMGQKEKLIAKLKSNPMGLHL